MSMHDQDALNQDESARDPRPVAVNTAYWGIHSTKIIYCEENMVKPDEHINEIRNCYNDVEAGLFENLDSWV